MSSLFYMIPPTSHQLLSCRCLHVLAKAPPSKQPPEVFLVYTIGLEGTCCIHPVLMQAQHSVALQGTVKGVLLLQERRRKDGHMRHG